MPDNGTRQPFPHGIAAAIRLDDDVDRLDPVQVPGIALFAPVGGTRDAECGNLVEPKGMAVRFAFHQNHLPRFMRLVEAVKAIQARFGP